MSSHRDKLRTRMSLLRLEERETPSGVPTTWIQRGAGGGGALFSPNFNPTNPNEIYVASDMSQVFRTTNAGANWSPVGFTQLGGGHEARVQFTEDPNIRYSLDYTNVAGSDLVRPSKSTNGGQSWQALTNDPTGGEAIYLFADPTNHNRLVVTDYTHLYFSGDGGQSWALKYTASNSGAGLLVGGAFWDGSNIYLGTNSGLLVSSNGGGSFSVANVGGLPAGQLILSFAGAKQGGTTRFLIVTNDSGDNYAGVPGYDNGGGENVLTLDWGQANWTLRNIGTTSAWPFYAGMALADVNTMYVAGGSANGTPTVYKSTNGGQTWSSVLRTDSQQNVATGWSGSGGDRGWSYGEMALGFAVSSADPNRLVITDLGFAHSSSDGGATWQALYVSPADRNPIGSPTPSGRTYHDSGLDNTTAWGVTFIDATHVFISNSDVRGQLSLDGGQTFGFGYTGHTLNSMYRVVKAANGTLYGATGSVHDLYQSTTLTDARIDGATGQVLMSTNQGLTWTLVHNFGHEVAWVATDPTNANRLYASVVHSTAGGIYVTNNLSAGSASTWTRLTSPPRTEGHPFNIVVLNDGTLVASYSGRRTTAFTASSGVFASTDGGQTWADRSAPGMLYWTKDVVVDPFDSTQNTWYAAVYSGWGGAPNGLGGLYKTTNRGVSWTRITSGLDRVESVTFNPSDSNEAFVTTETQGLWYSSNMRSASPTFTLVTSYGFRQPERVFFNPANSNEIWVTSFGGGVVVGTTGSTPPPPAGTLQFSAGSYSGNENGGNVTISVTRVGGSAGALSVQYATANGTATAGQDYVAASGTLNWADGDTSTKTFTIAIIDDAIVEGNETVLLNLTGSATGVPSSATLTISDNDVPPAPSGRIFAVGSDAGMVATVRVYNADGTLRFERNPFGQFIGGVRVAVGDVNGDGVPDVIAGAGPGGGPHVVVYNGMDGSILRSFFAYTEKFNGGIFVASGDVDRDGHSEIITGAGAGGGPHVQVFSGADNHSVASFFAYAASFTGGISVAAGDVDADGRADVITGAGPGGGPHVQVFSGVDFSVMRSFYAYSARFTGGIWVGAGDIDHDGRADVVTGAGASGGPHVQAFSVVNPTPNVIRSFFAFEPYFTGGVRVTAADVTGDGIADIITGAGPGGGPHVKVFDGTDLTIRRELFAFGGKFAGGVFVG